jgi:hypothetical protein
MAETNGHKFRLLLACVQLLTKIVSLAIALLKAATNYAQNVPKVVH